MKTLTIFLAAVFYCATLSAQTDTTGVAITDSIPMKKGDTMRIGNIIIIKRGSKNAAGKDSHGVAVSTAPRKPSRVTTNWGIVDIGFSNYSDQTNYSLANTSGYLRNDRAGYPALGEDDFKLRNGKSINVNVWIFMQHLKLTKKVLELQYGLGLELNNYRYKSSLSYKENGNLPYTNAVFSNKAFIFRDSISFNKNKLAADYLTVPLMLNFAGNSPGKRNEHGFNVAFGVSAGYLYSQRNKQRSDIRGKETNKGDYDLEKFKFSYIGEIGFGPLRLYASYSPKSMYEHSLDMRPYNFGIRLGDR